MKNSNIGLNTKLNADKDLVGTVRNRIITLLDNKNGQWVGTISQLGAAITRGMRKSIPEGFPTTPSVMRRLLNAAVPSIRKQGVSVSFTRDTGHKRERTISFSRTV